MVIVGDVETKVESVHTWQTNRHIADAVVMRMGCREIDPNRLKNFCLP